MDVSRRGLIGMLAAGVGAAIVRPGIIMPVKPNLVAQAPRGFVMASIKAEGDLLWFQGDFVVSRVTGKIIGIAIDPPKDGKLIIAKAFTTFQSPRGIVNFEQIPINHVRHAVSGDVA